MNARRRAFLAARPRPRSAPSGSPAATASPRRAAAAATPTLDRSVPFDGPHQAGVITPGDNEATFARSTRSRPTAAQLASALEALSARARDLAQGTRRAASARSTTRRRTPARSAPSIAPDRLTVTIAFGASLFDDRYGLRAAPDGLTTMPAFADDDLDPARCHGDVLLQICANRRDTVVHTLRELLRPVRDAFALRWTIDGFQCADRGPTPRGSRRNLFGFRDGTANPDVRDDALMNRLVVDARGRDVPGRARDPHARRVLGPRRPARAGDDDRPRRATPARRWAARASSRTRGCDLDPKGERIALDAHIRLANPRTPATADQRILRRGFNYHRGFDAAGQLDQGLIFVAFNQDIERQFATIQKRLAGEPMTDYITPVGGGYFYAPKGASRPGDWVGSRLFAT